MNEHDLIVTLDELAQRLHLSKRWLHQETNARRIPSLRAGKQTLFNIDAVRRVLAERAAAPADGREVSRAT